MGILRLFANVHKNYPKCLTHLQEKKNFANVAIAVESFVFDLNAIIHPICQKAYGYGESKNNPYRPQRLLFAKIARPQTIPNEREVFEIVCRKVEELARIVNPSQEIIISLDGVAGVSKQCQQRQRRFRAGSEIKPDKFDSNKITTGSKFMNDFSKHMHFYIQRGIKQDNWWNTRRIIFSNHLAVGEGEHKCIRYMANNPNQIYCVYSPDADLIMLTLGIMQTQNIYILRENIYDTVDCKYFIVDVQKFKQLLLEKTRWTSFDHDYNQQFACWDFIFVTFMLGNDFLPHSPSLEIPNNGLELLIETCSRVSYKCGHITYRGNDGKVAINMPAFKELLKIVSAQEKKLLEDKSRQRITYPDNFLQSFINDDGELDFEKYRHAYHVKKFGDKVDKKDVCTEYFRGMQFVIRYYMTGIPDWHWSYKFHYSPFVTDLLENFDSLTENAIFSLNSPLTPFEQLLSVLPPQSCAILPDALQKLTFSDSPIADFYPEKVELDFEGKRQEYEAGVLVSFVDISRLKDAYNSVKHMLTPEQEKMNRFGRTYRYELKNGEVITTPFDIFTFRNRICT